MKRRVMITVDVEAQPARASEDHIERLIYGRFGDREQFGIGRMFDIADKHGVGIACFLDYAAENLYGDALLDVGRYITARGHDLQVHLHPEFMSDDSFVRSGIKRINDMFEVGTPQARLLIEYALDAHNRVTSNKPVAFRGGGYRYNGAILEELARNNFTFNTSYNASRENQPFNIGSTKQFRWSSGILELPISCVFDFKGTRRFFDYNFNAAVFMNGSTDHCLQKHIDYLEAYYAQHGTDAIAVMVLHSWSFLTKNDKGHYSAINRDAADKFDALMALLSNNYAIVTANDLANAQNCETDICTHNYYRNAVQSSTRPLMENKNRQISIVGNKALCDICEAPVESFHDYHGHRRKCSQCGSLERQRTFVALMKSGKFPVDLSKTQHLLLISPSVSESRYFRSLPGPTTCTLDVRPECGTNIIADICHMPHVKDGSFDVVYACHVLSHVHSLEHALAEICRVLTEDGVLINHEPVAFNKATIEIDDPEKICAHYGADVYRTYQVGRFRIFGDKDFEMKFLPLFKRQAYEVMDGATNTVVTWNLWSKTRNDKIDAVVLKTRTEGNNMNKVDVNALCQQAETLWQDTAHFESQKKSIALFKEAFQLGERVKSAYRLGVAYLYGRGVEKDMNIAHEFLMVPELDGVRFAQYYRGILFANPEFCQHDNRKALNALQRALKAGVDAASAVMEDVLTRAKCPICKAIPTFDEPSNAQACPQCHALNVHRAFAHAFHKNVKYLLCPNDKLGKMEWPSSNGMVSSNVKIACSDQGAPALEFFVNTLGAQKNFDFIIACCEGENIKNTLDEYWKQPFNPGLLVLVVNECKILSKEDRRQRRKEYVSDFC